MRLQFSLAIALAMLGAAAAFADPQLRGATLPSARTVPITATATAFFTVLNSGTTDATNCSVATSTYVGSELNAYIITSQLVENGVAVGTQSPSFTIPASGRVDMVVGVARDLNGSFNTEANIFFRVDCDGGFSSPAWPGVNSLQVQFLNDAPDIIMIADTITRDGIAGFNGNRTALVAIAAVNIGAASAASDSPNAPAANEANLVLEASTSRPASPLATARVCELDGTGTCSSGFRQCDAFDGDDCLTTQVGDTPVLYAMHFIMPEELGLVQAPNVQRFIPVLNSPQTFSRAATSVAIGAISPSAVVDPSAPFAGYYELVVRNSNDATGHTLTTGNAVFDADGRGAMWIYRAIDRGFFTQIVTQVANVTAVQDPVTRNWALGDIQFLDTREGDTSRDNDHYIVDQSRMACSLSPFTGGRCTASAGGNEQISGEPEIFDAGEAFMIDLSPDATVARNAALRQSFNVFNTLVLDSISVSETSNVSLVSTQPVSAEGRSQIFTVNIDGCEVLIQFVPESFEGIGTRIFFQSTSLIASISVPSDPDRCPPGSPIRAIAEASGLEKGDYFEIETLSLRGPATQDGTKIIFEFAVSEDPTDPDSLTRTFDLVLARPTG